MKPVLPFLETMITQSCNLSCSGCSNYSDLSHSGYVTWEQGKQSITNWLTRIDIPDFGIMGGEPLINPQVREWITGVRKLLPDSQIRFTTNGHLLHKHLDIIDLLSQVGNCVFKITVHTKDNRLERIIDNILQKYSWTNVNEHGIDRLKTNNNFRLHVRRPDVFVKTYQGTYESMSPYHSVPVESFEICEQKTCPLLWQDRIYKCSTAGLLKPTLDRVQSSNANEWAPYIDPGVDINCSDKELESFIQNFGKPHSMCGMCPSISNQGSLLDHSATVSRKKYILYHDTKQK